jgi:hypothetical protein
MASMTELCEIMDNFGKGWTLLKTTKLFDAGLVMEQDKFYRVRARRNQALYH